MPAYEARAPLRRRDIPLTPERIVELAGRPEGFHVSWRWRDEWLVHRCAKLVKAGKLRRIRRKEKGAYFYGLPRPVEPVPSAQLAQPAPPAGAPAAMVLDGDLFG